MTEQAKVRSKCTTHGLEPGLYGYCPACWDEFSPMKREEIAARHAKQ